MSLDCIQSKRGNMQGPFTSHVVLLLPQLGAISQCQLHSASPQHLYCTSLPISFSHSSVLPAPNPSTASYCTRTLDPYYSYHSSTSLSPQQQIKDLGKEVAQNIFDASLHFFIKCLINKTYNTLKAWTICKEIYI